MTDEEEVEEVNVHMYIHIGDEVHEKAYVTYYPKGFIEEIMRIKNKKEGDKE